MGNSISREDFPKGYNIMQFDLTPDLGGNDSYKQPEIPRKLRVQIGFKVALPHTCEIICMGSFKSRLTIDRNYQVSIDYVN